LTGTYRTRYRRAPWHLGLVGGLSALWNGIGAFDFTATVTRFAPYMSGFPQDLKDYWYAFPLWMLVLWGVAVWGGFAGSVLVLLRRKLAVPVLGASLLSEIATMLAQATRPAPEGAFDPVFTGTIICISVLFLAYAQLLTHNGYTGR
jgi:hypothetical protein